MNELSPIVQLENTNESPGFATIDEVETHPVEVNRPNSNIGVCIYMFMITGIMSMLVRITPLLL